MFKMKSVIIVGVFIFSIALTCNGQKPSKQQCQTWLKEADKCLKVVAFIGEKALIPKTVEDYKTNCKRFKAAVPCAKRLRPCLDKFPKMALDIGLRHVKKIFAKTCDNETAMIEFLKVAPCLDASLDKLYEALNEVVKYFYYLARNVSDEAIIPVGCCIAHKMLANIENALKEKCGDLAAEASRQMNAISGAVTTELLNLACTNYPNIGVCYKKLPREMQNLEEAKRSSDVDIANTFILEPLLDLADRLVA